MSINRFKELIDAGIAAPTYSYDDMCDDMLSREYNNIFSIPSDTHMTKLCNKDEWIITGKMISTPQWKKFICQPNWGAVEFWTTGYTCLCDFLYRNGLQAKEVIRNGEKIYSITPKSYDEVTGDMPTSYTTTESQIPRPIAELTYDRQSIHIQECFESSNIVKSMNESKWIKGNNWCTDGEELYGLIGGTMYKIKLK